MMISKVRGRFEKFTGTVELDEDHPENTTVDIQIEAASINTRDAQRDAHLRSPDFFNAEVFPYLTFKSKRVEVTGDNKARLTGDLTIRDVTHEVALDVEFNGINKNPWGTSMAGFRPRRASTARIGAWSGTLPSRPAACWSARMLTWRSSSS